MILSIFVVTFICVTLILVQDGAGNNIPFNPEVSTPLGRIKGSFMTSRLNKKIYAFRGIRYAEPPTGDLRFKVAIPVKPWSGAFDASKEGTSCSSAINEDCLRLNVYTTKVRTKKLNSTNQLKTKRPVIIFIHSGGFYTCSAQSRLFGPQYLLDHDVVLVTINFRLGPFGFLSTGDSVFPGNIGLKDQVATFRWVRDNIAAFGGDPNSVTLMGYNAGSRSISLHLVSPMSRGLFHRAICMSGSLTNQKPLSHHEIGYAKKLARLLNCPDDTSEKMVECLRTIPPDAITYTFSHFLDWHLEPESVWLPVVEPNIPGLERFLTDQPANLIRKGMIQQVPILAGLTRDEFSGITMIEVLRAKLGDYSMFQELNENWDYIAPISFEYERNTSRSKMISQKLRDYYFKGEPISLKNVKAHGRGYADSISGFPMYRFVRLVAAFSKQPVYYYRFVYEGKYGLIQWVNTGKPYGVSHLDDLQYILYMTGVHYYGPGDRESPVVDMMTAMWANFAKTGQPIPKNDKAFEGVTWEPFTPENNRYMEIDSTLTMKTGFNLEAMHLYESLFPLDPLPRSNTTTPDD
ncbi:esterase E4-like [Venturia canescens]|uniref:esterase E4-like n=1 Tax=Venturia canescens TaxID=32260 RepID=UPI001C9BE603|nr:esterase E4-like [Venturia canescens]